MKSFTLKSLVAATCLLGSAFTACAESSSSSVWKVSKGQDHIYVGGTVHILPVSEFPLPSQFDLAYKNSDSIVLEADLPDATDQQGQMAMMQAMMFQNGQTLKTY